LSQEEVAMTGNMTGKVVLVTGASSGIGLAAAEALAERGARVLLAARDRERGERALARVGAAGDPARVELLLADLAAQPEVRRLAAEVQERTERLDVLVNNAGVTVGGLQRNAEGVELTFAVNHLAPFLLTALLRPLLEASAPARVVTVASDAHRGARLDLERLERGEWSTGWGAYGESKLANILFTRELARRLDGSGVVANCLHPGVVRTGFGRSGPGFVRAFVALAGPLLLSPEKGAETVVYLASSAAGGQVSGRYFVRCREATPSAAARDDVAAARLWQLSERLTGLAT
jgi:NAD(P)-dependent dehydrogenase (short-subunit alcohol dehydrogenase family)